ncbi:MAG TPA: transcriptional regulator [Candidatus Ignatzschineria merdigallinarum]|uniref:Transcriptional regulator n=1 Tax=Candidatus Ignatzschineria merdigallinarum TaxID=2838621 RepID=A0A9D1Q6T0_9GAMM|nr:transcriptional regulator [Candidatus Ignatzschineria merdigallinarum]
MDYKARLLPTREALLQDSLSGKIDSNIVDVDLVLSLLATTDLLRAQIYDVLSKEHDVSEGKFILLMSLYREGETSSNDLALRIGVKPATVSIMIKRMLSTSEPFVQISHDHSRKNSHRLISLTQVGIHFIRKTLPNHSQKISEFSQSLSEKEKEACIEILHKLLKIPQKE